MEPGKRTAKVVSGDVILPSGRVLTQADFERMADEAENADIDIEAIRSRASTPKD